MRDNPSCLILSLARRCRYCTCSVTPSLRRRALVTAPVVLRRVNARVISVTATQTFVPER
jgi:hypothetical protein